MALPDCYVAMYTFGSNHNDTAAKTAANLIDEVFTALKTRLAAKGLQHTVGLLDGDHNFGYTKEEIDEMSPATVRKLSEQDKRVVLSLFMVLNDADGQHLAFNPLELKHASNSWQKKSSLDGASPLSMTTEAKAFPKFKNTKDKQPLDPAYFAYSRLLLDPREGTEMAVLKVEAPADEEPTIDDLREVYTDLGVKDRHPRDVALKGAISLGAEEYEMRRLVPAITRTDRLLIPFKEMPYQFKDTLAAINTETLDAVAALVIKTRKENRAAFGCAYCGGQEKNRAAFGCPYCGGQKKKKQQQQSGGSDVDVAKFLFKE